MGTAAKVELRYFKIPNYPGPKPAGIEGLYPPFALEDVMKLQAGEPVAPQLLLGKTLPLSKDYGNQLADFLYNAEGLIIVSEKGRAFFEKQGFAPNELQYVPMKLKGKKGQPRMPAYSVVNLLRRVSCLDSTRSEAELVTNSVDGSKKWNIISLRIDESKVPQDARLFHLAEQPLIKLIRSDFLEAIRAAGLTGLKEQELGKTVIY
jgi:uncharacterized protein DUF1629